jgi:CRISPR-associated protein Cas2
MTLFISYDFTNDRTRTKFSKFLTKYGRRIQYSVYEIKNSQRYRDKVITEINTKWRPMFEDTDSIWVWEMTDNDAETKYGYAEGENRDVVFL